MKVDIFNFKRKTYLISNKRNLHAKQLILTTYWIHWGQHELIWHPDKFYEQLVCNLSRAPSLYSQWYLHLWVEELAWRIMSKQKQLHFQQYILKTFLVGSLWNNVIYPEPCYILLLHWIRKNISFLQMGIYHC